jgi:hypothetical protein
VESDKNVGIGKFIFADFINLGIQFFFIFVLWGSGFIFAKACLENELSGLIVLTPIVSLSFYFITLKGILLFVPPLKRGVYALNHKMAVIWFFHLCLNRSSKSNGSYFLIRSSRLLTWLYYRILGCKLSLSASLSIDLELPDPSLIEIGKRVVIGGRCYIGAHSIKEGRLILGRVQILDDSFVSLNTVIGPNTVIGKKASTGVGNYFFGQKLPESYELANFQWSQQSPRFAVAREKLKSKNLENQNFSEFHLKEGMLE